MPYRFIDRAVDADDRRVVLLQPTPAGRAAYWDAVSWAETFLESIFDQMGDQALQDSVVSGERFIDAASVVRGNEDS